MLYEQYAKKIRRYADIRDSVLRFKIPIICVLSAIIVALAGFLATKGIITEQVTGAEQYTYGDRLSFDAKALFSDVLMEYSSDGGETWTEEQPRLPGEYLVRAVSERSFGQNGYSDGFGFCIVQRAVTLGIADQSVEWRIQPNVEAQGLAPNDKLDGIRVLMEDTVGTVDAVADVNSARIVNALGEDVTSAYVLTAETKSIAVTPRTVTLKVKDVSRQYDGTHLSPEGYVVTAGSIIDGHNVSVSYKPYELIYVGTANIVIDAVSVSENGVDVTEKYRITLRDGSATVTKRMLSVISDGATKQFDGRVLEIPDYRVQGSAAFGDRLDVVTCDEVFFAPMEKARDHILSISLTDAETGEDRSSNYQLNVEAGKLFISKRSITVETPTDSKEYDGVAICSNGAYTVSGELAEGHRLVVDESSFVEITEPGTVVNSLEYRILFGEDDLSSYYEIKDVFGRLTVTKIGITVSTDNVSGVYSGKAYSSDGAYTVTMGKILDNHKLAVLDFADLTDPGSLENTLRFVIVPRELDTDERRVLEENDLSSRYYNVTESFGSITVSKRTITISTGSMSVTYNGETQYCKNYDYSKDNGNGDGLLDIHTLRISGWIGQRDQNEAAPIKNAVKYSLYDASNNVIDINTYYTVTTDWGTVTVTRRDITVITGSSDPYDPHMFDGRAETSHTVTDKYGDLVNGQFFRVESDTKLYKAGTVDNVLVVSIFEAPETPVTDNYDITYEYGTLKVVRRTINIEFTDISQMYDASPVDIAEHYTYDRYAAQSEKLVHYLNVRMDKTYINVADSGKFKMIVELSGTDIDEYRDSYEINLIYVDGNGKRSARDWATVTIRPIPLTVYIEDGEKIYDGYEAEPVVTEAAENTERYPSGHRLVVSMRETYVDASKDPYRYTVSYVIRDASSEERFTDNYDVTLVYTERDAQSGEGFSLYTVKHRPIHVTNVIYERVWEYDGTEHFLNSLDITPMDASLDAALADGQYLALVFYPTITNVSKEINAIVYDIRDTKTGMSVKSNYAITEDWGTIEVTPRPIVVETVSLDHTYDGTAVENRYVNVYWKKNKNYNGLVSPLHDVVLDPDVISKIGPNVLYDNNGNVIGISNVLAVIDIISNDGGNTESVLGNYSIEYSYGTLTIYPRDIIVTTGSATMEYNGVDTLRENSFTYEGLILGHRLDERIIRVIGSRMRVGETKNTAKLDSSIEVYVTTADGSEDMTGNYNIVFDYGILEVTPIKLKLQPNYVFGEYNGTEWRVTRGRCTTQNKLLQNGVDAVLYVSAEGSRIEAGVSKSTILSAVVRDAYGIGVYSDGEMSYYYFSNNSSPMLITVSEGTLRIYNDGTVELVEGVSQSGNFKEIFNYGCSYDLELLEGEINISKRRVYISVPDIDGYEAEMILPESWISQGTMANGHYLFAPTYVIFKDGVGVSTVLKETIQIYTDPNFESNPLGENVMRNYEFVIKNGTVEE